MLFVIIGVFWWDFFLRYVGEIPCVALLDTEPLYLHCGLAPQSFVLLREPLFGMRDGGSMPAMRVWGSVVDYFW